MKKILIEERKLILIEILNVIHEFCVLHKIQYSLGYGSLLGAVRHKGFIPWDDDIDIIMLRDDYRKFELLFPQLLDGKYKFGTVSRDSEWPLPFGKVYNSQTCLIENKANTPLIGVNIDVFPMDYFPDDKISSFIYKCIFKTLCYCLRGKLYKINQDTPLIKKIIAISIKIILVFIPGTHTLVKWIDKLSNNASKTKSDRVYYWPSIGGSSPIPLSMFKSLIMVPFESKLYFSVSDPNGYLIAMYGPNYMTPPPEKNRISYHTNDAYWI